MEYGELLIRWTIRLSMGLFAAALAEALWRGRLPGAAGVSRWLWTLGCGLFLAHVAAAFHFYHGWSHAHAVADTAAKTRAAIGWEFGGGVYVNHLFALAWTIDVAWSWLAQASHRARPRWLAAGLHCFLLFIAVNGLIVFKGGAVRWVSVAVATLLILVGAWRLARRRAPRRAAASSLRTHDEPA
ncbi:MAG: hypothetical protein KDA41_00725, partial [Planctomycetales bacterium]|nr:hypothetical protein [Planctomycetales bacterium]